MPRVIAKKDTLDEANTAFEQAPLIRPAFLNSVPKCGTHLLRNIVRMFVPVEQQYHDAFIQVPILRQHIRAFDPAEPKLSWGHLLFSDESSMALRDAHHIILVRDPYDWVLARARFFLSENFQGDLDHLKGGRVPIEDFLNMMIFGIYQKVPTLSEIFMHNGAAWLGTRAHLVRYEELVAHVKAPNTPEAATYFETLLGACGIALPEDWQERVRIGSDRRQSGTARENLDQAADVVPKTLPARQRELVEYAAPGLRRLLGYY